jgi:hypothetical protein
MKKMQRDEFFRQGIKPVSPPHSAGEKQPRSFEFTGMGGRGWDGETVVIQKNRTRKANS